MIYIADYPIYFTIEMKIITQLEISSTVFVEERFLSLSSTKRPRSAPTVKTKGCNKDGFEGISSCLLKRGVHFAKLAIV